MAEFKAKGKAGRKPYLEDKTIQELCRLSASTVFHALRCTDPTIFSFEKKAELAKHFVLRAMPQKIESDGSFAPKTIVLCRNDKALKEIESRGDLGVVIN